MTHRTKQDLMISDDSLPHTYHTTLQQHRDAIDAIDHQLLALFDQRAQIVAQVGQLKAAHRQTGSYIRPGREANMLRALLDDAKDSAFPRRSIAAIWRLIIGSSLAMECPLNTITFDNDPEAVHVSAHYFGLHIPHQSVPMDAFFAHLERDEHAIAIVPFDLTAHWWTRMPDAMRVFACLPFIGDAPTHLALGHVSPEPTGNDVSLFFHYDSKHVSALAGFHTSNAPLPDAPENSLCIGAYAAPYPL